MNDTEVLNRAAKILEKRAKYNKNRDTFTSPDAVKQYLRFRLASETREVMQVLYLNNKHRLIESATEFVGDTNICSVYPKQIIRRCLMLNASAIILSHNHPSGNPEPSTSDDSMTKSVKDACDLLNIRLLDHIIVGTNTNEFFSYAEKGLL